MVAVRDRRGTHTNALGLRLGRRQRTYFGAPDSFRRHCDSATRAGLSLATPVLPGIGFDIDLPEDFARLRERRGKERMLDDGCSGWSSRARSDAPVARPAGIAGAGRSRGSGR
jgi:2-phospho-L-lactate guanylyltransferase (CobY/MobA/RfbA family)